MCNGGDCHCGCDDPYGGLTAAGIRQLRQRVSTHSSYRPDRLACGCYAGACRCSSYVPPAKRAAPPPARCYSCACVLERPDGTWVRGLAAAYGVYSGTLDDGPGTAVYREILAPGAFAPALSRTDRDVRVLINHDPAQELARYRGRAGDTAQVWSDSSGLHFEFRLPDTPLGWWTLAALNSGVLGGCSFGFAASQATWSETSGGLVRRVVSIGELRDVSLVRLGAYSVAAPSPEALVA